jgi:thiamine kinase-like enzyme
MSDEVTHPAGEVGEQVGVGHPDADLARVFEDEALRVVRAGEQAGVALRVIGALAFHHHCPQFGSIQAKLNRVYTDIDFAGYAKQSKPIRDLFIALGYDEDLEINSFHAEAGRLIFNNPTKHIHVDVFIDRARELANHVAAAASGVTPPLLHRIEPGPCTVVPFIDGETLHPDTIAGHPDHLDKIVRAVRTYHDRAVFANEIHVFDMIRDYTAMAHEVGAALPMELQHMFPLGDAIALAMERDQPAPVACHCDLLSENFIVARDGRLWVIDWEYGGMADPYFDLGDFCVEHPLSGEEERTVLTTYCGGWDEHRYGRMMLYKLVADHWWSIWAMIQHRVSTLDFDFFAYGMNRIERFWRNARSDAFKGWLERV